MYINHIDYINKDQNEKIAILQDSLHRYRTKSLFYEYRQPDYGWIWTLKDYDYATPEGVAYSLKQIYMNYKDPTEGRISTELLTSHSHWQSMTGLFWFKPILDKWREELEIRIRADALLQIRLQSDKSTSAAQFLAQGRWKTNRGRPSKAEKERELKREIMVGDELDELYARAIN